MTRGNTGGSATPVSISGHGALVAEVLAAVVGLPVAAITDEMIWDFLIGACEPGARCQLWSPHYPHRQRFAKEHAP